MNMIYANWLKHKPELGKLHVVPNMVLGTSQGSPTSGHHRHRCDAHGRSGPIDSEVYCIPHTSSFPPRFSPASL